MKLPPEFGEAHPGPQFGVAGSRALTGVHERPIIGTIVKPALGLRPHETAEMVRELVEADVDFIKDDEKLMSPAYSSLAERVKAIMPIILDREQKTGKKVMYAFGISHADPDDDDAQSRYRRRRRRQRRRHQHQLDRLRRLRLSAQALAPRAARPSQRLGHPHPPSRPRPGFQRLSAVLAAARRRPVPDQRHRREILGAGRIPSSAPSRRCTTPLFSPSDRPLPVAGSGPMGRPGAGDVCAHGPHAGSAVSLRRRRRQPSRRPGGRREGRPAGLGGGGRRHSAGGLRSRVIANSRNRSPNSAEAKGDA